MKKRKKYRIGEKIKYLLDEFVSKGFLAQILLLAGTSISLTLLFGIITMKLGEENYVESYWISLMHMIDQGTITADEKGTDSYFMFMLFVTLIGMAFTSTIIAIMSSAIQEKLNELKKGHSGIIEKDHVVILGFDENANTICQEIVDGRRFDGGRMRLVIADDYPKEEMEHTLREYRGGQRQFTEKSAGRLRGERKIKVLFRSGDPVSENTLSICAVKNAKAVVINRKNDTETIRILLALTAYLKKNKARSGQTTMPRVVALIHDREKLSAALAAAEIGCDGADSLGRNTIQIMYDGNILESLYAQTCVQPGLPFVLDGIFNYRGSSINIEADGDICGSEDGHPFVGKTLSEISDMLEDSIPLGFIGKETDRPGNVRLNPSDELRYTEGDRLIYLSEEKKLHLGARERAEAVAVRTAANKKEKKSIRNFLFIGCSTALPGMLRSLDGYCAEGSCVSLIAPEAEDAAEGTSFAFGMLRCEDPYRWSSIRRILDENGFWFDTEDGRHLTNIAILSENGADKAEADEKVMLLLLNIRQYLRDRGNTGITLTSEMRLPQNQMLIEKNSSNDFVVASEITNRMIAQIADDPRKRSIIDELLVRKNAVIELHPLTDYADTSKSFNFEGIFEAAAAMGKETGEAEIPLGWIWLGENCAYTDGDDDGQNLVLNPSREELEKCRSGGDKDCYRLIVLTDGAEE